jgi:hypothetical protein
LVGDTQTLPIDGLRSLLLLEAVDRVQGTVKCKVVTEQVDLNGSTLQSQDVPAANMGISGIMEQIVW